jgi:hypothetical protein
MAKVRPGTTVQLDVRRTDPESKADKLVTVKLKLGDPPAKAAVKQK